MADRNHRLGAVTWSRAIVQRGLEWFRLHSAQIRSTHLNYSRAPLATWPAALGAGPPPRNVHSHAGAEMPCVVPPAAFHRLPRRARRGSPAGGVLRGGGAASPKDHWHLRLKVGDDAEGKAHRRVAAPATRGGGLSAARWRGSGPPRARAVRVPTRREADEGREGGRSPQLAQLRHMPLQLDSELHLDDEAAICPSGAGWRRRPHGKPKAYGDTTDVSAGA